MTTIIPLLWCFGAITFGWLAYVFCSVRRVPPSVVAAARGVPAYVKRTYTNAIIRSAFATLAIGCALQALQAWGVLK